MFWRSFSQSQQILQARLRLRIAALKVSWKLADDHCPEKSACTTAETVCPTKTNSTLVWRLRVGSLCQDPSNSVLSTGVLSSAMNLCIRKTSSGYLLLRAHVARAYKLRPVRTWRRRSSQFLSQRPVAFSLCKLMLSFAVEARFISIDC
jgi:hypothetical protein